MAQLVPTDDQDLTKADASPTKAFFVDIITKDILLDEAIQDLVDNCIDGAKRLKPGENADLSNLNVAIDIQPDRFSIEDNCGGIPLEVARKYAFKFGRAKGFTPTSRSVGQFGVGMKRALFKMGDRFKVSTTEPEYQFDIDVNVPVWASDDVNWDFDITGLTEGPFSANETGTRIVVTDLEAGVTETFKQEIFAAKLRNDLRVIHQDPMRRGLRISLNGEVIIPTEWQLKQSSALSPAALTFSDNLGGSAPLRTRIFVGVGESSRAHAGWYIFCNGRNILDADQGPVTGWAEVAQDGGVGIPKYHGQFARFRGYAFLDSDDASVLPWNTTKTSLDLESDAYRLLRGRLIDATRPVIDFLNALDAEQDQEEDNRPISRMVSAAPAVALERITAHASPTFSYQVPARRTGPALTSISFKRPAPDVVLLKEALGANNNRHIGELAFDYAFDNLVEAE